jgi:hypothetical protein
MTDEQGPSKRSYSRGTHFNCTIRISPNGEEWHHARATDLSSGGLKLTSTVVYEVDQTLWFDIIIEGFLTEFECKTQGIVRRKQVLPNDNVYGIEFVGLNEDIRIRIDESVRADRPVSGTPHHTH